MADNDIEVNVKASGIDDMNKELDKASKSAEDLGDSFGTMDSEMGKFQKTLNKLGSGGAKALKGLGQAGKAAFKAIGTAIKAAGIGLLIGLLGTLWEAIKKNQKVMDLFSTAVNAVGIIIQPLVQGIGNLIEGLTNGSDKFDAFGKVIKNVMKLSLKPLQITFNTLKLGILGLQIAWEKLSAALSKKKELDEGKIAELKGEVEATKERMKELAQEAGESFTEMKALGKEVIDGTVDAVKRVQEGAARAATEATKNMERLNLEQERLMLQYQNAAELQRQIRDDESRTFEERIRANEELGKILQEQAQTEIDTVNKIIRHRCSVGKSEYVQALFPVFHRQCPAKTAIVGKEERIGPTRATKVETPIRKAEHPNFLGEFIQFKAGSRVHGQVRAGTQTVLASQFQGTLIEHRFPRVRLAAG